MRSEDWNSDSWNPLDYGQDFDFKRPFSNSLRSFAIEFRKLIKSPSEMKIVTMQITYQITKIAIWFSVFLMLKIVCTAKILGAQKIA